jgi:hypothetical protein
VFPDFDLNRSMIFNPLIVVASELGLNRSVAPRSETNGEQIVRAFRRINESVVDLVGDDERRAFLGQRRNGGHPLR